MSGDTIILVGCGIGDDIFTTDARIFGDEITWNITRLRKAAEQGMFGPAESYPMSVLPPMSSLADSNVNWQKVTGMIDNCARGGVISGVLNEPSISVTVVIGDVLRGIPVDGSHRICARRLLKLETWPVFIVPPELEANFRVLEFVR